MMWSIYEIIIIWTAVVDGSEEWSSQLIFQFKQFERSQIKSKKKLATNVWLHSQLVEHRTGIAEVSGSNPVEALIFFQASSL